MQLLIEFIRNNFILFFKNRIVLNEDERLSLLNKEFIPACENNDLNTVKKILTNEKLKYYHYKDNYREMGLITCSIKGHLDLVKYLLTSFELNHNVLSTECVLATEFMNLSLVNACINGHLDIVKYLLTSPDLKKHANINYQQDICFNRAAAGGYLDIVKYLLTSPQLKKHANIHNGRDIAFIWACTDGHLDVVRYLLTSPELEEKIYISHNNGVALQRACEGRQHQMVKYLLTSPELKRHANIHEDNDRIFKEIVNNIDSIDIIEFLIFDCKIEKTLEINNYVIEENRKDILNMFEKRDFVDNLDKTIIDRGNKKSSVKIVKI